MSVPSSGPESSLSGLWSGTYSYPYGPQRSNAFMAMLVESGGRLTGATDEACDQGALIGATLHATLDGSRQGQSVSMVKTYDADHPSYDMVIYEGTVNAEATEIEGRWYIPGNWSGSFLMVRNAPGQSAESHLSVEIETR